MIRKDDMLVRGKKGNVQYEWAEKGKSEFIGVAKRRLNRCGEEIDAAQDCARRAIGSTWWEWSSGSRLHHWWWPGEF